MWRTLYLLLYHCKFNPIKFVWGEMKRKLKVNSKITAVKELVLILNNQKFL